MDSLLLSIPCDSIVAKVCKEVVCQMKDTGSDWADVEITSIICCSLVKIVAIVVAGFLLWKLLNYVAEAIAAYYNRACNLNDRERKQQAELTNKLLDFQKGLTFPYEKDDKGEYQKREYDTGVRKSYQQNLINLIKSNGEISSL